MADEITISASLAVANVFSSVSRGVNLSFTPDMSGATFIHNVQEIGTAEEAIVMGDVSTPGWAWFRNLDTTNYVEIRPGTGKDDLVRLNAGEWCVFRFAADVTAPYAVANTASVKIEYLICSN